MFYYRGYEIGEVPPWQKILAIDDEVILTKTFAKLLERQGYEVFIAKTDSDALEMADEDNFDLVLCDIRMPGINGVVTIKKLRDVFQRRYAQHPPEIFITGYADSSIEREARELEPIAYIEKPFDNEMLLGEIRSILWS